MAANARTLLWASVLAAALGYFVDLYDIVLFGVVRVASLADLGITGADGTTWGIRLINLQMTGMLVGGFFWGALGDRYGRRFALLATITVFSLANLANGFITSVEQYAVLRFLAGFGLAGELGNGITLVSELLPENRRGYGTTLVSFPGLVGALTASVIGAGQGWRMAYEIGGAMGLAVLALRFFALQESALFRHGERSGAGEIGRLFASAPLALRFVAVTLVGVPIWYVSALFVNLAPEVGRALGFDLTVAQVLRSQAVGLALGSAASGVISEALRNRRAVVAACLAGLVLGCAALLRLHAAPAFVLLMFFVGLLQGYWTVFVTMAAEQFGTDLRATVSTSIPNLVRAATVPVTLSVQALAPAAGFSGACTTVGVVVFVLAFAALARLPETWGRSLAYREAS